MADLSQHLNYTAAYSGLVKNLWLTIGIAGICLIGYEIEVRVPRRRGRRGTARRMPVRVYQTISTIWKGRKRKSHFEDTRREAKWRGAENRLASERARVGDRESWEFGYIYQPKSWALNRGPPLPRWPLQWIISALKVRERDMPEKCGLDITLHARFLRACFFYTLMQTCVVLPILMPLHMLYAPDNINKTSMLRAGIDGLVASSGSKWLWVHAVLMWWISFTWTSVTLWIGWGGLAYRRRGIARLRENVKTTRKERNAEARGEEGPLESGAWPVADDSEGIKKFKALMIVNVPPDMRDENTLRDYFDYYIHLHRVRKGEAQAKGMIVPPAITGTRPSTDSGRPHMFQPTALFHKLQSVKEAELPSVAPGVEKLDREQEEDGCAVLDDNLESEVDEVVLVRKLGSIYSLRDRRTKVLRQLEMAHVDLAKRILKAVAKHKADFYNTPHLLERLRQSSTNLSDTVLTRDTRLPAGITRTQRLDLLTRALADYVDDEDAQVGLEGESVWNVLYDVPRELLDPYQALTHLKATSMFRKQNAPLIDYLTTKLVYLTMLLDDAREKDLSEYQAASTAFVVFKDAKTARLALRILDSHPKRSLACHTVPAPDWTDLLWPRLGRSVYRSELVRSWVTFFAVWAFTLAWIFPVSFFCTLTSLTTIGGFIPQLEDWLNANPNAASTITSLAPVILVALLTIAICPILLAIANKAQTIVTRKEIHNSVMERFWKFLMVNAVVFFAIGQGAIEAYLTAFQTADFDPLPLVASAFPTAAPYFASYLLLQVAIQPFFEVFRFGLPAIVYWFGTRVSSLPRQRDSRTEHPTFSHFSQVPYQLLGGAIMHLFMLLNPLVIPFTLVYYGACYLVWKRQFTYVYGRLYETNGERSAIRIMRYSHDALALSQFVLFAFFILNKAKANAIATGILFFFTLIAKLVITRALRRRFQDLDAEEADILCPPVCQQTGDDDATPDRISESPLGSSDTFKEEKPDTRSPLVRHTVAWMKKWQFAAQFLGHMAPTGYRRPIPFDRLIFSRLDRWITFDPAEVSWEEPAPKNYLVPESIDPRLAHEPDQPIHHDPASKLVMPHPPLQPWEDIPPYQRMRGYNDQPGYTDDYDDFLWLPRDPLSTLDLDDTVEMRLSLTTSCGGPGRIGDWPPQHMDEDINVQDAEGNTDWQEVMTDPSDGSHQGASGSLSPTATEFDRSPSAQSERRLIDPPDLAISPVIGSEVFGSEGSGLHGPHRLRNVALAIGSLRRSRHHTETSEDTETGISLQTLGSSVHHGTDTRSGSGSGSEYTPRHSVTSNLLSPERGGASPSPIINIRPLPKIPRATPSASSTGVPGLPPISSDTVRSHTLPAGVPIPLTGISGGLGVVTDVFTAHSPQTAPVHALTPVRNQIPPPRSATHLTFAASELGRSPTGRRPHGRLRSGTVNSRHSDRSHPHPHGRTGSGIMRTASMLSRDHSISSVSPAQRALLNEVMEEERVASESAKHDEATLNEKEREELLREQERLRKSGVCPSTDAEAGEGTSTSTRRPSWLSVGGSGHEMARGTSVRRQSSMSTIRPQPHP